MADLVLQPTDVIHYKNEAKVSPVQIATKQSPIVIIGESKSNNGKHVQTRVLPFTDANADKEALTFVEKMAFYPKVIRNNHPEQPSVKQEVAAAPVVAALISNYFNQDDGYADEFAEFMDGWNNKPVTGFENNLMGFFTEQYVKISSSEISEFSTGLTA